MIPVKIRFPRNVVDRISTSFAGDIWRRFSLRTAVADSSRADSVTSVSVVQSK